MLQQPLFNTTSKNHLLLKVWCFIISSTLRHTYSFLLFHSLCVCVGKERLKLMSPTKWLHQRYLHEISIRTSHPLPPHRYFLLSSKMLHLLLARFLPTGNNNGYIFKVHLEETWRGTEVHGCGIKNDIWKLTDTPAHPSMPTRMYVCAVPPIS